MFIFVDFSACDFHKQLGNLICCHAIFVFFPKGFVLCYYVKVLCKSYLEILSQLTGDIVK